MRFRKKLLGAPEATEEWRRDAWNCDDSGEWRMPLDFSPMRNCWLDAEGEVWLQRRWAGSPSDDAARSVAEESDGSPEGLVEKAGQFFTANFVLDDAGADPEMSYSIIQYKLPSHSGGGKRVRYRSWVLAGGRPVVGASHFHEQEMNFARIAASAI